MSDPDDDAGGCYASPPCFMHELDPAFVGFAGGVDAQQRTDVMRWRKAERQRLLAARRALDAETRRGCAERIAAHLDETLGDVAGATIGVYWPVRGEPNLRHWMERVIARGAVCALPVVIERHAPLVFRAWKPGDRLERGMWNIPEPADGAAVTPDIVVSPLLGFDRDGYRLGYGSGFYDRTLAALARKPRVVGVGYAHAALATIFAQPHDVPMDEILTENGRAGVSAAGARDA